jgi:F420-0:gamma-glutamyl ligase
LRVAGEECENKRNKAQALEDNANKLRSEIAHLEEDVKRVRTARDKELVFTLFACNSQPLAATNIVMGNNKSGQALEVVLRLLKVEESSRQLVQECLRTEEKRQTGRWERKS